MLLVNSADILQPTSSCPPSSVLHLSVRSVYCQLGYTHAPATGRHLDHCRSCSALHEVQASHSSRK